MLWAKDVRQEMLYTYPELDFSTISRRLGEMWANVPSNEKYNWRRRAKRLAAKGKDKPKQKPLTATTKTITSKFLNRNTHSARPKKGAAQAEKIVTAKETQSMQTSQAMPVTNIKTSPATSSSAASKASGTAPVDVAAHLKLLGDSLILIGQRLKEHEVCYKNLIDFGTANLFSYIFRDKLQFREVYRYYWTVYCARLLR